MIPPFRAYLFDIDGTLLDSAEDICGALQQVLSTTQQPGVPFERLRGYIGFHFLPLFEDLFPGASTEQVEPLVEMYRQAYKQRDHRHTRLYPGVLEAMRSLGGLKSTATTKGTPTTRIVLERFGLLPYFNHVQGTDGFPCKPAPDVILTAMEALEVSARDVLMVGDSTADMEAGRAAGVKTCCVTYGYGDKEKLRACAPDYWVSDLRELLPQP